MCTNSNFASCFAKLRCFLKHEKNNSHKKTTIPKKMNNKALLLIVVLVSALLVAAISAADSTTCTASYHYGTSCVSTCPATHVAIGNRCYYKPRAIIANATIPLVSGSKCSADVVGMFFSWVAYEVP